MYLSYITNLEHILISEMTIWESFEVSDRERDRTEGTNLNRSSTSYSLHPSCDTKPYKALSGTTQGGSQQKAQDDTE
jgi:hypothetical protein